VEAERNQSCIPLKIDLHVHTSFSLDSSITLKELVIYSRLRGLDGVAVTEHNVLNNSRKLEKISDLLIIPGIEISTSQGHVLAFNTDMLMKPGLSFAETIDQIHDANGLAILAHPTGFFKGVDKRNLGQDWDAIEVINASAIPFSLSVHKNRKIAVQLGLPQTGGSDAHFAPEIGIAYTLVKAEKTVSDVVKAIKDGEVTPQGKGIPWHMRLRRTFQKVKGKRNRH
jgi:predicted metal-dependent phosphoesterase TrpH